MDTWQGELKRLFLQQEVFYVFFFFCIMTMVLGLVCSLMLESRSAELSEEQYYDLKYGGRWGPAKVLFSFKLKDAGVFLGTLIFLYRLSSVLFFVLFIGIGIIFFL